MATGLGRQSIRRDRRLRKPRRRTARPRRTAHPRPRPDGRAADLRRRHAGLRRRRRPARPLAHSAAERPPGRADRLSAGRRRLPDGVCGPAAVAAHQPLFRGPPAGANAARRQEQRRQLARPAQGEPAAGHPRRGRPARRRAVDGADPEKAVSGRRAWTAGAFAAVCAAAFLVALFTFGFGPFLGFLGRTFAPFGAAGATPCRPPRKSASSSRPTATPSCPATGRWTFSSAWTAVCRTRRPTTRSCCNSATRRPPPTAAPAGGGRRRPLGRQSAGRRCQGRLLVQDHRRRRRDAGVPRPPDAARPRFQGRLHVPALHGPVEGNAPRAQDRGAARHAGRCDGPHQPRREGRLAPVRRRRRRDDGPRRHACPATRRRSRSI